MKMIDNLEDFSLIKDKIKNEENTEFSIIRSATGFSEDFEIKEWQRISPTTMVKEYAAEIMHGLGNDLKGELAKIEVLVYLMGGVILYKEESKDEIAIQVIWKK